MLASYKILLMAEWISGGSGPGSPTTDRVEEVWSDFASTPGRIVSLGKRSWAKLNTTPTVQPVQKATPRA